MSHPPTHTMSTPARTAFGPSRDKTGKRQPHHHTLSLLGGALGPIRPIALVAKLLPLLHWAGYR